jgi:hypothetical protein
LKLKISCQTPLTACIDKKKLALKERGRVKGVGEIVLSAHVDRICMAGQWVVGASSGSYEQRHTFRDRLLCMTAFLSCWRWGHIN